LADLYAGALLDVAEDAEQHREIAAQLEDLVAYMGRDRDFAQFLVAVTVDTEARRGSLERLFRGRMNDLLVNLLLVMNRRRRLELVRMVSRCVQLRLEEQRQQQEVTVQTAVPLVRELRLAIERVVGKWVGKTAILIEEVRPELIGGLVIRVKDKLIDGSLRRRLQVLQANLRNRTGRALHEADRFVSAAEN
jgi:F-type H+-transporting ATPase subunit delta